MTNMFRDDIRNRLAPTDEEFASKYNIEVTFMSSPRQDWHVGLLLMNGRPLFQGGAQTSATMAKSEARDFLIERWRWSQSEQFVQQIIKKDVEADAKPTRGQSGRFRSKRVPA